MDHDKRYDRFMRMKNAAPITVERKAQQADFVVRALRESYRGRTGLREAWLIWSNREGRISYERLRSQLQAMGFDADEGTATEIMSIFGQEVDGAWELGYNGFVFMVSDQDPETAKRLM